MKKFFIRIFFFGMFFFIILIFLSMLNIWIMKKTMSPKNLKIDEDVYTIIIGDSHTRSALIDEELKNTVNISTSSQHYLFSYYVIKVLLPANPQIRNVVLGYSYHNLNEYYDLAIVKERYWCKFFSILDDEGLDKIKSRSFPYFDYYLAYRYGVPTHVNFELLYKVFSNKATAYDFPFLGKSYKSRKSNLNSSTSYETIKRHFYLDNQYQNSADLQLDYLNKIIAFCRDLKVNLYLLKTPLHSHYHKNVPDRHREFYTDYTNFLITSHSHVIFLDHSRKDYSDSLYGDIDHLNYSGAEVFTHELADFFEQINL